MNARAGSGMDRLLALPRFTTDGRVALKPGFDRIEALLDVLGHPERTYRSVLVAGTNGKGSVAAMLSALLTTAGYRAGLHTSPHLRCITERMRVDGRAAPSVWLDETVDRHASDLDRIAPSFFEATVAFSLAWFAHESVDVAVVEVGLGGRLDATNILTAEACAIVSVGFDHMDILGDTLAEIAREKAGIAKHGRPLVIGALPDEARVAVLDVAGTIGAPVIDASLIGLPDDVVVDLPGPHQRANARVALALMQALDPGATVVRQGLSSVRALSGLRARLETVSDRPLFVVDIGHNPEAIATALKGLPAPGGAHSGGEGFTVVLGMLADKDAAGVGRVLAEHSVRAVWTVPTSGDRGRTAQALAEALAGARPVAEGLTRSMDGPSAMHETPHMDVLSIEWLPSVAQAVQRARLEDRNTLFIGSHEVAAAALDTMEQGQPGPKSPENG